MVADRLLLAGEDTYYMLKGLETVAEGADVTTILTLYIREGLNAAREDLGLDSVVTSVSGK